MLRNIQNFLVTVGPRLFLVDASLVPVNVAYEFDLMGDVFLHVRSVISVYEPLYRWHGHLHRRYKGKSRVAYVRPPGALHMHGTRLEINDFECADGSAFYTGEAPTMVGAAGWFTGVRLTEMYLFCPEVEYLGGAMWPPSH